MQHKLSACVICYNEEDNIERCLKSLTWCDEILVMDSFSSDRTVERARRYTPRVYQHEWLGYIGQKNLIRGMAKHPWVLFLDADEEVSLPLIAEIQSIFSQPDISCNGFCFPRMVFYMGRWIRHGEWYPDLKLRLFKKDLGHSSGREPHDKVVLDGPIHTLRNPIYHYTYNTLSDHLDSLVRFAAISAQERHGEGYRCRWSDITIRPLWRFLKGFLFKGGFLDGRRGLYIALASAFGVATKYMMVWEQQLQAHGVMLSSDAACRKDAIREP